MLSRYAFPLLIGLLFLGEDSATANDGPARDAGVAALGSFRIGMSKTEVEAAGYGFTVATVQLEGDLYRRYRIRVSSKVTFEALLSDDIVGELSTASPGYKNAQGVRVGATLAELQRAYPSGSVVVGTGENGPHFSFFTNQGGEYFEFSTARLGQRCLRDQAKCPANLGSRRSIRLVVRDLSPRPQ